MLDNHGWSAHLINVPGNIVRYRNATSQLRNARIPYNLVDSVNGLQLSPAEIDSAYSPLLNRDHCKAPLTPQEIGCYLSHKNAWIQLLSSDSNYALIMEDDFQIYNTQSFKSIVNSLAPNKINVSWDIIKLFILKKTKPSVAIQKFSEFTLIHPLKAPTCMTAYLLSRVGAEKLLRAREKIFRPVDEDIKYYWEFNINVLALDPAQVGLGQQHAELGTVGEARRAQKKQGISARKAWIQIKYQSRILLERLIHVDRWIFPLSNYHG